MFRIPDRLVAYRIGTGDDVYVLPVWGEFENHALVAGLAAELDVPNADVHLLTPATA